jgi:hypothetical protein
MGVCGVVGGLVGSLGWAGEFHTSQCSAFQSGVESAWGMAGSGSSGSAGMIWHRCSGWGVRSGGQAGCVCSWSQRQHTQYGSVWMRLCVSLWFGRWLRPMVKWRVVGSACVKLLPCSGGDCSGGCWCRRRRPKVLRVAWGRAGLSRWMRCSVVWSWSSVRMGSEYLILSMCGRRGAWSKRDGCGCAWIWWCIWMAARRRCFHALRV